MALFLVIVGRPIMYGLALGGGEGVEQVPRGLLVDSEVRLSLSGYKGIDEIWGKREAVLEKAEISCECTVTTELWCTSLLHYFRANVW
jgi:isopentenyl diphosphate isomerase/L-lactate dehydrogenase-like FMN-dependent dehydrogenase